jgi:hypothetical protein
VVVDTFQEMNVVRLGNIVRIILLKLDVRIYIPKSIHTFQIATKD